MGVEWDVYYESHLRQASICLTFLLVWVVLFSHSRFTQRPSVIFTKWLVAQAQVWQ